MAKQRLTLLVAVLAVFGFVLGACGDDDDGDDSADDTSTSEVTDPEDTEPDTGTETDDDGDDDGDEGDAGGDSVAIVDFTFSPEELTVASGAEISVSNRDGAPHTYTASDGSFDSGSLSADGGEGTVTAPDEAGTYDVFCAIHPSITGTLTVEG